jgi:hypothetical protein
MKRMCKLGKYDAHQHTTYICLLTIASCGCHSLAIGEAYIQHRLIVYVYNVSHSSLVHICNQVTLTSNVEVLLV